MMSQDAVEVMESNLQLIVLSNKYRISSIIGPTPLSGLSHIVSIYSHK